MFFAIILSFFSKSVRYVTPPFPPPPCENFQNFHRGVRGGLTYLTDFEKNDSNRRGEFELIDMKVVIPRTHTRHKKWFSRPPEASISRMTKLFGVRRDQISSSKPPMLDYTCGEHVVNTRWLNVKKCSKNVDFLGKNERFLSIFSYLVNAFCPQSCSPHV